MTTTRREFVLTASAAAASLGLGHGAPSLARLRVPPRAPLKILILGGTGFLGPHTVRAALARGHTVTLFNRGRTEQRRKEIGRELEFMEDVEILYGNRDPDKTADDWKPADQARDPASPRGLTQLHGRNWDAVIDNSGYYPRHVKASAGLLAPHVKHYTFISSISVYADSSRPEADETDRVGTISDPTVESMGDNYENYGPLKALCELAAEGALPGRVANVRPGLIVGPGDNTDRFTYWPVRIARGGEVLAPGSPSDPVQIIDVRDLGEWLVRCLEHNTAGVFNAVGPAAVPGSKYTMGEMLDACVEAAGSDARFTWCDAAFLREQNVSAWGDMPVWIPPEGDSAGSGLRANARARAAGLTFRPVPDTARATLEFWKTLPEDRRAKMQAGIKAEREAEVLAAWHKGRG